MTSTSTSRATFMLGEEPCCKPLSLLEILGDLYYVWYKTKKIKEFTNVDYVDRTLYLI